jgi:hypothetical protein
MKREELVDITSTRPGTHGGRELAALAEGRPTKKWRAAPAEVVPTLGF